MTFYNYLDNSILNVSCQLGSQQQAKVEELKNKALKLYLCHFFPFVLSAEGQTGAYLSKLVKMVSTLEN